MRQTVFRLLASGTMAATLALGLTAAAAGAAVTTGAQPAITRTCHGYSCHGHDPVRYRCSVSSTTSTSDHLVTLWNRYSFNCNANWGRARLKPVALLLGDRMQVFISTTDSKGKFESMCYPGPSDTGHIEEDCTGAYRGSLPAYTDMVDGTNVAWATVLVYNGNSVVDNLTVKQ
jgi:hypothetical protein